MRPPCPDNSFKRVPIGRQPASTKHLSIRSSVSGEVVAIARRDKSPTSMTSAVVPSASQQLNSRRGQNAACPWSSRPNRYERGGVVALGKFHKLYIELD